MIFWRDYRFVIPFLLLGSLFVFSYTANAQSASLYFSPSSGKVNVGDNFSLSVKVNTSGVAINAAEGSVVFDPLKLQVTSIAKSGSIFNIWAEEPKYSNSDGTVEFGGGLPSPGFSGASGTILNINFRAKSATTVRGYTEIVLVSGAVLANDGEGSNILASLGKANYYIGASGIPVDTVVPEEESQNSPLIKSSTHPDQEKWYSSKNPKFNWELPDEAETVSFLITDRPTSNPGTIPDGKIDEKQFENIADGINYLHLRFRENGRWGQISHFKFQIDTTAPKSFNITVADNNSTTPKLTFETSDELSGVDHYEVKTLQKDWEVINKELEGKAYGLNSLPYGEHEVSVKAVDKAGNSTIASTTVIIPGGVLSDWLNSFLKLFRDLKWLLPALIVVLVALAHEFFHHSVWWRRFKKHLKSHDGESETLNLRKK